MKDTLTPSIYSKEPEVVSREIFSKKMASTRADILYFEIRNRKIFYALCVFKEVRDVVTSPLRKESLRDVIKSIQHTINAIIIDTDSNSLNVVMLLSDACRRFSYYPKLPFLLFESTSTSFLLSREGRPDYIDDVISKDISVEDLYCKIRVLNKLKELDKTPLFKNQEDESVISSKREVKRFNRFVKRISDITIAFCLLVLLSPVMLVIAVLIKVTSKGPVIYKAARSGCNYRIFGFIKFRSMYLDADKKLEKMLDRNQYSSQNKGGPIFFKMSQDPRITPVGRFLRNTSLDELPQLFNVLRGEMSLVGNRPLPLYEARTLTTDDCVERFDAPAGITGLWQVKKRGAREMSTRERIDLDIKYARNCSLGYDVKIMLQTPKALIQKDNV